MKVKYVRDGITYVKQLGRTCNGCAFLLNWCDCEVPECAIDGESAIWVREQPVHTCPHCGHKYES